MDGLKAIDAEAPLGVPALKALADEMSAKNPLIRGTYENALNGVVMPNIPQMGRFWSSMKAAFEIATSGRASPEAALKGARKSMKNWCEPGGGFDYLSLEYVRLVSAIRKCLRSQRPDNKNLQDNHRRHPKQWNEKSDA